MKKTMTSILAILMILTLLLTGCGTAGGTSPAATQSNSADPTKSAEADKTEAPVEKKVMTAMFLGSSQDQAVVDIIQATTDKFNADNAFQVEFQFETYENEQYKTKLSTVMAANSAPDVFFTWSAGYLKPFVQGDMVYEIGQLLNADQEWKDRFNDGVFGPVTYDGKIYAVPHGQNIAVMFYNTRLFAENAVPVPKTFDELLTACDTFNAKGIVPISAPVKDAWIAGQLLQQMANGVGGMELFNGTVDGTLAWNDPRYVEAGTYLGRLVTAKAFQEGYLGMSYDEGRELFAQEKAAMFYMGSWDLSVLSDPNLPVSKNIGVFNIPASSPDTGNAALGDVDQCLAISKEAINPEAAAAYIKLFSDKEAQEAYAYDAKYLLSTKTVLDTAKLNPLFIEINNLQQSLTGVTPWMDRVFGAGEGVEFNNAAQAIIAGKDPAERMDALQQFAKDNALR